MNTAAAAPLLRVTDLRVTFHGERGSVQAVQGVSFDLSAGESLGLVGESGSGKSTIGLAILRLLPPDTAVSGRIEVEGADAAGLDQAHLRRIRGDVVGMILQDPTAALNPLRTVASHLAEALLAHERVGHDETKKRSIEALADVGLPDPIALMRAYPHELSGGMRQRVLIAMALLLKPKLLIADEPTTALDVTVQAQIMELLRDVIKRHGLSLLLITHDLAVVAHLTQRVAVMQAGRIVESGTVKNVLERPQHAYTQALLAAAVL